MPHLNPVRAAAAVALAALVIGAVPFLARGNSGHGPPIYVIEQGTTKVFVFGGAAPADHRWLTPRIAEAFRQSDELWQENPAKPDPPGDNQLEKLGRRESGSLFDDLSAHDGDRVLRVAATLEMTREALAPYYPWAAALVLQSRFWPKAMASIRSEDIQGYFQQAALDRHIPIHSEYAMFADFPRFFASLSQSAQLQWLSYQLDHMEEPLDSLLKPDALWAGGDIRGYEVAQRRLSAQYPELYAAIEVRRNREWVERIAKMLEHGGAYFVDVGVMHVIGPDSIVAQAGRRGMRVRRL